jgi:hypothetical protein
MTKMSVLVVWGVLMFAAGMWAQVPRVELRVPQTEPVISGDDLGFRVENRRGNTVVGRFVVRIDGQWLEIQESTIMKRLTER